MKLKITVIALLFFVNLNLKSQDTIKVNTHQKVVIKTNPAVGHTYYESWGVFPEKDVSYRKVYLYLEFGCAPGLKCGEWDYLNHLYIGKVGGKNGDSLHYELARFITPYGFYWNSSQNWKHGWYFDVTDFSELLHDSVQILYKHTGYEANNDRGWTVTLDFNFIKGEPARIPQGYKRFFEVNAPYGNSNSPFKSFVPDQTFQVPSQADYTNIKVIQTGHGMDKQENCSEFCSKKRILKLDGTVISEKNVWRDDCGFNSLFPQAGTWVYDRAGWCPGAPVLPDDIYLKTPTGKDYNFSLNMQEYENLAGGSANYYISAYAFYFKNNQKKFDVDLESILSPSTEYENLRLNPTCGAPIIRVKNMGTETVTALDFEYGNVGGVVQKIWVPCMIKPFESQVLNLEAYYHWANVGSDFFVKITKVNGQEDEYQKDNIAYSKIVNSAVLPNQFVIVFKTNNAPSENSYTLKDAQGKVIRNQTQFLPNTIYRDTVFLENNKCYTFEFSDEGSPPSNNALNKDGLDWWANTADGSGYIQFRRMGNNTMLKNFNSDFGTKHVFNFNSTYPMNLPSLTNFDGSSIGIQVLPNPTSKLANFVFDVNPLISFKVSVYNSLGQLVFNSDKNGLENELQLVLNNGVYNVVLMQEGKTVSNKFVVID
ncbi:MAG: peptide-N-glycosidase F-related protein [Bacteroidota bacterium]|nr:peptide-N-glycosidase F-related protein [Bacteroidota bacterium]